MTENLKTLPTMFWPNGALDVRPHFLDDANLHRLGMVVYFFGCGVHFN